MQIQYCFGELKLNQAGSWTANMGMGYGSYAATMAGWESAKEWVVQPERSADESSVSACAYS